MAEKTTAPLQQFTFLHYAQEMAQAIAPVYPDSCVAPIIAAHAVELTLEVYKAEKRSREERD